MASCKGYLTYEPNKYTPQTRNVKSEVLLVARKPVAEKFANGSGLAVAGSDIAYSVKLKSLGVTVDQTLSFDQHVKEIVKASNFHMKAFRHIRSVQDRDIKT